MVAAVVDLPIKDEYESRHTLSNVARPTLPEAIQPIIKFRALLPYLANRSGFGENRAVKAKMLHASSSVMVVWSLASSRSNSHTGCRWQYLKYRPIPAAISAEAGRLFKGSDSKMDVDGEVVEMLPSAVVAAGGVTERDLADELSRFGS